MKLLAIDCSTYVCSVALSTGREVLLKHELVPQYHAKKILFLVDELFKEMAIKLEELTAIAVCIGPGSFTGLRIAASVAQGLAFGLNLPLVPVSSLQTLAQTAYKEYAEPDILVAVDARIGEVYWGEYQFDEASGIMLSKQADRLTKPESCQSIHSILPFAVGTAFEAYNLPLTPVKVDKKMLPKADALLKIALESVKEKRMISPDRLQLNYLRNDVAHRAKQGKPSPPTEPSLPAPLPRVGEGS